ncbi:MAG: hypothetical protein IIA41_00485 [SAR324 cluster bacterium]|nr:hypothetical protein [SAR324 cluster bacterium]
MAAGIPIRFKMSPHLAERVRAVCEYLNLTAEGLAEYALEQEVTRQEVYKIRDEITIQEIGKNILGEGQSLHIQVRDENDELNRHLTTCQMCLQEFKHPLDKVDGPLFCRDCLDMAKGGDFSKLDVVP